MPQYATCYGLRFQLLRGLEIPLSDWNVGNARCGVLESRKRLAGESQNATEGVSHTIEYGLPDGESQCLVDKDGLHRGRTFGKI